MQNRIHEETDTRIVVHVIHELQQWAKTIEVRTMNTYVVVILECTFHDLTATQPFANIWPPLTWTKIAGFTTSTLAVQA